jgi:hypothetical protein
VLLPIVATFLLVVMNRSDLLGEHVNTTRANILGGIVVLIATGLGIASLIEVIGMITGGRARDARVPMSRSGCAGWRTRRGW